MQAAIDIVVMRVADHIQQPDEAPGPAAAFVVIDHVDRVGAMAQFTEQRLEVSLGRQQTGGRWLAQLGALGVDEAGTWDVALGIAGGAGEVHQNQLGGIQACGQIGGLYDQWQAGKGRHDGLR